VSVKKRGERILIRPKREGVGEDAKGAMGYARECQDGPKKGMAGDGFEKKGDLGTKLLTLVKPEICEVFRQQKVRPGTRHRTRG